MPFDGKQMEVRVEALEKLDQVIGLLETPGRRFRASGVHLRCLVEPIAMRSISRE